jgi:hypothetical protein
VRKRNKENTKQQEEVDRLRFWSKKEGKSKRDRGRRKY